MAIFDKIACKRNNFLGYQGEAPTNETEYNAVKDAMFSETAPTWSELKTEIDAYVDPRVSAKAKLIAGEALTEDEANTIVL